MASVTQRQLFCPTLVKSRLQAFVLLAPNSFHVVTLMSLSLFFPPCFQLKILWWLIGVKGRRLSGGKVFACMQSFVELKSSRIKAGKVLALQSFLVFLEQTGVTD